MSEDTFDCDSSNNHIKNYANIPSLHLCNNEIINQSTIWLIWLSNIYWQSHSDPAETNGGAYSELKQFNTPKFQTSLHFTVHSLTCAKWVIFLCRIRKQQEPPPKRIGKKQQRYPLLTAAFFRTPPRFPVHPHTLGTAHSNNVCSCWWCCYLCWLERISIFIFRQCLISILAHSFVRERRAGSWTLFRDLNSIFMQVSKKSLF